MSSERKIYLLPHHAARFVDCVETGETMLTDLEIYKNGPLMTDRVKEVLGILQLDPNVIIILTDNPKKDYICAGRGKEDGNCFGVNNPQMSECVSKEVRIKEKQIADDMGLKLKHGHPFSIITERRDGTSWGKE